MNKIDIKRMLDKQGVSYSPVASKEELEALLDPTDYSGDAPDVSDEPPAEEVDTPEPTPEPEPVGETMVVEKSFIEGLVERMAVLEAKATPLPEKRKEGPSKFRQAKVWFIDGEVVIGYGKSWNVKQEDGSWKLEMEIFTQNEETKKETKHRKVFNEFRQGGDREMASIIEVKEDYVEKDHGKVEKGELTKDQWDIVGTGIYVDSIEKVQNHSYLMRLEDGREFTLHQTAIN